MSLTIESKPLRQAIETAMAALISGKSIPVLTCAMFKFGKESSVTCDSLDAACSVKLDFSCDEELTFIAPPKLMLGALKGDDAVLKMDGHILHVDSFSKSKINTIQEDAFPKQRKPVVTQPVDSSVLNGLRATSACTKSGSGDAYECVFWDSPNSVLVSGVGQYMNVWPAEISSKSFLLHKTGANLIASICSPEDELSMGAEEGVLHVKSGNKSIWLQLWEGQYPRWQMVFGDGPIVAEIDREQFLICLNSLTEFIEPEFRRVTLIQDAHSEEWMIQSGHNGNEMNVRMNVKWLGSEPIPDLCLNANSLTKVLRHWEMDTIPVRLTANALILEPQGGKKAAFALVRM